MVAVELFGWLVISLATPRIYTITYKYKNFSNVTFGRYVGGYHNLSKNDFVSVEGDTSEPIGKITQITISRYHRSTNSSTNAKKWSMYATLNSGSTILATSDVVTNSIHGTSVKYVNTFTESLPTPTQFNNWTSISLVIASPVPGNDTYLYWGSDSSKPILVTVSFISARDMGEGADPPVINESNIEYIDSTGAYTHFGNKFVQGQSNISIRFHFSLDSRFPYLTSYHDLTLTHNGVTIYSTNDSNMPIEEEGSGGSKSVLFNVGVLDVYGNVSLKYILTDSGGHQDTYTTTLSFLQYTPPVLSNIKLERYEIDYEQNIRYVDSGDKVAITITRSTTDILGLNEWTFECLYKSGLMQDYATKVIATQTTGETYTYSRDRSILTTTVSGTSTPITFNTSENWDFIFQITDFFGVAESATLNFMLDKSGGLFNIYPDGVSVGMRGTGDITQKKFEVANTHKSYFYGGIEGVTSYTAGEVETGGTWIDGSPIYRYTYLGTVGVDGVICTLPDIPNILLDFRVFSAYIEGTSSGWVSIPYVSLASSTGSGNAGVYLDGQDIIVVLGSTFGTPEKIVVIAEYTKSSSDPSMLLSMITGGARYPYDEGENIPDGDALNIITGES